MYVAGVCNGDDSTLKTVDFVKNLQTHLIPAKTGIRLKKLRTYQPKHEKMVISIDRVLTLNNRNSVSVVWNFLQI